MRKSQSIKKEDKGKPKPENLAARLSSCEKKVSNDKGEEIMIHDNTKEFCFEVFDYNGKSRKLEISMF